MIRVAAWGCVSAKLARGQGVLIESALAQQEIKTFITTILIHNPDYPLADDEALITSGLIDPMDLGKLTAFIEETFGVLIEEEEFTTEHIDTLQEITTIVHARLA